MAKAGSLGLGERRIQRALEVAPGGLTWTILIVPVVAALAASATAGDPDQSNGLFVFRSTLNGGASWNFPARPVVETNNVAGNFLPLEDKQFMAVDHNATACAASATTATPGASCTPC